MDGWTKTEDQLPEKGTMCDVITPNGNPGTLYYGGHLWFTPDKSMYVYYVPTWWRKAS